MGILANWKIYLALAGVLVLFYYMYTAKIAEVATLQAANKTLTETVKSQEKLAELRDNLIKTQESLLVINRQQLSMAQLELGSIEDKIQERSDAGDDAHPYLKELFKELSKVK